MYRAARRLTIGGSDFGNFLTPHFGSRYYLSHFTASHLTRRGAEFGGKFVGSNRFLFICTGSPAHVSITPAASLQTSPKDSRSARRASPPLSTGDTRTTAIAGRVHAGKRRGVSHRGWSWSGLRVFSAGLLRRIHACWHAGSIRGNAGRRVGPAPSPDCKHRDE